MHEASHFIAEIYVPRGAALPEPWRGSEVRNLCAFLVPDDEIGLYVFEAASREAVAEAGGRAGIAFDRVSAAQLVHGNPTEDRRERSLQ